MEITNQLSNNAITPAKSPGSSLAAVGSVVSLRQQQQQNVLREVEGLYQNNRRLSGNFQQISKELQARCTLLEEQLATSKNQKAAEEQHEARIQAIMDRVETLQKEMKAERDARIVLENSVNQLQQERTAFQQLQSRVSNLEQRVSNVEAAYTKHIENHRRALGGK